MSRYDSWLTTDHSTEERIKQAEWLIDEWEKFAEAKNLPVSWGGGDEGETHLIYNLWETLWLAIEEHYTIEAEDQMYEDWLAAVEEL